MNRLDELNAFGELTSMVYEKELTDKDKIKAKSLFIEGLIRFLELYGNNEIGNVEVDIRKIALWVNSPSFENQDTIWFTNLNKVYKYIENCLYNNIPLFRFLKLSKYQYKLMENTHREQLYNDYKKDCEIYPCLKCVWYSINESPFGSFENCTISDNIVKTKSHSLSYRCHTRFSKGRHKKCRYCTTLEHIPNVITDSKYYNRSIGITDDDISRARSVLQHKINNLDNSTIPIHISESEYVPLDFDSHKEDEDEDKWNKLGIELGRLFNNKKSKQELLDELRQAILIECLIKFMDIYAETEIGNNHYANITNIAKYVYKNYKKFNFTSVAQAYDMIEGLMINDFNDNSKLINSFVKYKDN